MSTLTFKYVFPDDYNPQYVTGAHGSVTPSQDIIMNFFMERSALPKEEEFELNDVGLLGKRLSMEPSHYEKCIIRYMQSGIVMNKNTAIELRNFLDNLINQVDHHAEVIAARSNLPAATTEE